MQEPPCDNLIYLFLAMGEIKNILIYLPTLEGGGAEKKFSLLASYFSGQADKVVLLTSYQTAYKELIDPRVEVVTVIKEYKNRKRLNQIRRGLFMPWEFIKQVKVQKPDVIIATVLEANLIAGWTKRLFKVDTPLVIAQANILEGSSHPRRFAGILKKNLAVSKGIICNSPDTKSSLLNLYPDLATPICIIGNPVKLPEPDSIKAKSPSHPLNIIHVGRHEPQKDQQTLLSALAKVKGAYHAHFLGDGNLRSDLENQVASLKLQNLVTFHGFVDDTDSFYKNADVFVLSSTFEGFGNVIIEALAHGIPVISTDCPGGPRFILNDPEIGTRVPVGDSERLAAAIDDAINRYPYSRTKCRERAEDFSLENIGAEYLKWIQHFVDQKSGA